MFSSRLLVHDPAVDLEHAPGIAPGKRTLTAALPARTGAAAASANANAAAVQRKAATDDPFALHLDVHAAAARGTAGGGAALPHLTAIQAAFGRHDVGSVQAQVGGAATEACAQMQAEAYAAGDRVAFADAPSLHTAAHEAAHVVQQRAGVSLADGVGRAGDAYEQHADMVADRVVRGESAEHLLDELASGTAATAVQHTGVVQRAAPAATSATAPGGGASASTDPNLALDLQSDMGGVIDQWQAGALLGVGEFAIWALEQRLEDLTAPSWKNFLVALLGNTIWAGTAFASAAGGAAVFAISMAGIAVNMTPSIPGDDVRGHVSEIQRAMDNYIVQVRTAIMLKRQAMAAALIQARPGADRAALVNEWASASLPGACRSSDRGLPTVDQALLKDQYFTHAQLEFENMKAIDAARPDRWGLAGSGRFVAYFGGGHAGIVQVPAGGPGAPGTWTEVVLDELVPAAVAQHQAAWHVAVPTYEFTQIGGPARPAAG